MLPGQQKNSVISNDQDHIGAMSGLFVGQCRLYLIVSNKNFALKVAKFGLMDTEELHGDTLQPGGQLETPGPVLFNI